MVHRRHSGTATQSACLILYSYKAYQKHTESHVCATEITYCPLSGNKAVNVCKSATTLTASPTTYGKIQLTVLLCVHCSEPRSRLKRIHKSFFLILVQSLKPSTLHCRGIYAYSNNNRMNVERETKGNDTRYKQVKNVCWVVTLPLCEVWTTWVPTHRFVSLKHSRERGDSEASSCVEAQEFRLVS